MPHILAVASQKGGVAKTTTVASLGTAFAEMGRRVLLVDLDPQACLSFSLGLDPDALELSIHDVLLGKVPASMAITPTQDGPDLLPATIDLAGCEALLLMRTGREYALRNALADLVSATEAAYDDVLIDCPPSLGVLTINGLTAANAVLIPLQCETLSHRGFSAFSRRFMTRGLCTPATSSMTSTIATAWPSSSPPSRVRSDSPRRLPRAGRCCRRRAGSAARWPTGSWPPGWWRSGQTPATSLLPRERPRPGPGAHSHRIGSSRETGSEQRRAEGCWLGDGRHACPLEPGGVPAADGGGRDPLHAL